MRDRDETTEERRRGFITIKAVHVWGPFIFQLAVLVGGWFTLQQKVEDMRGQIERMEAQIVELRGHVWK